jgi:hypothetical protein
VAEHARYADLTALLKTTASVTPDFARRFAMRAIDDADSTMGA